MAALRLTRLALLNTNNIVGLRVSRLQVDNTPPGGARALRVTRLTASTSEPTAIGLRLSRLSATNIPATQVSAGVDQALEPWTTATLIGAPTGGTWVQQAGTAVVLTQIGNSYTYRVPATVGGSVLRFIYTVNGVPAIVQHTALRVTERAVFGGAEVPLRILVAGQTS